MAAIVTRGLTANSRFARELIEAGQDEIEEGLKRVGEDAVRRVNQKVSQLYDNNRSGEQSKGGIKLLGSFYYRIEKSPGPGLPARLSILSRANAAKVMSLEYGSDPHEILPKRAKNLVFDVAGSSRAEFAKRAATLNAKRGPRKTQRQARGGVSARDTSVKASRVMHPGTRQGRFMRDGLEGAVRAAYRVSVTVP